MAMPGICKGCTLMLIITIMTSTSMAILLEAQQLPQAIKNRQGVKLSSKSRNTSINDSFSPLSSPESSIESDYVYIASLFHNRNHSPHLNNAVNEEPEPDEQGIDETNYPPPTFDFGMLRNITARTGHTATINCRVDHLGDKSVSWIRKRDLHILTAGVLTYTSDERFKVVRTADSKDWTLHVKYAQPRDSGIYECQVNTEPKISMAFRLNVIVTPPDAKAIIAGPTDLYVKVGSVITLTCLVKQPTPSAHDIGPIYWYRGPYILTPFVAHPNEAAIDLQRISMESTLAEKLQSRLRIANAQLLDTGNYTCMPTTAEAASVVVNVIHDESPAAMQKSKGVRVASSSGSNRMVLIMALAASSVVRWLLCCNCSLSNFSILHINYEYIHYCIAAVAFKTQAISELRVDLGQTLSES